MSPGEIAALLPGLGRIASIERIKHGLTNQSWLVRADDDAAVVVRVSNTEEVSLQIDRPSEMLVLEAVDRAGIGPQVLVCDPSRRLLVTRYMGPTWSEEDAADDKKVARLATLLRKLHALTPQHGIRTIDLMTVVEGYLNTLDAYGAPSAMSSQKLRLRARGIADVLHEGSTPCLSHNDVHSLNIVESAEGLRLIDWEYAGVGERLFDLAAVCIYHRYDKLQRAQLLSAYADRAELPDWHRFELACWLFDYIRDLWTAVRELTEERPSA